MSPLYSIFPLWSVLSQLVALLLLLGTQRLLKRRLPGHFDVLNEFLCCFTWIWWSLETTLIGSNSWMAGNLSVFIRLVAFPYVSQQGLNSPCGALFLYWTGDQKRRHDLRRLGVSFLTALGAVPVALVFCHYYWTLLGVTVSTEHSLFTETKPSYFLTTTLHYGVLYELVPSFLMFLPAIFNQSRSLLFLMCDSLFVLFLVYFSSEYTGSFMNPMTALAYSVFWHSLSPLDYAVHVLVFWAGPFIGTWMATRVKLYYERYLNKQKLM